MQDDQRKQQLLVAVMFTFTCVGYMIGLGVGYLISR